MIDPLYNGLDQGDISRPLNIALWDEVKFKKTEWLMKDFIPRAELSIAEGEGGIGKTSITLSNIARASRGDSMPDGTPCSPMKCLIIAFEDSFSTTKARLRAHGANLDNILLVESVGPSEEFFTLPTHGQYLRTFIEAESVDLVYIDALFSHFDENINSYKGQDVRRALAPLTQIAHDTGATIIATRHWGKGARSAADRGMGSSDIRNVCRSVLTVGKHPSEEGRFVIAVSKSNLGATCPALTYSLRSTDIEENGVTVNVGFVEWGETVDISADEIANTALPSGEELSKRDAACDMLSDFLSCPKPSEDVYRHLKREGDFSRSTVKRAANKLRVRVTRVGFPSSTVWELGSQSAQSAQSAHVSGIGLTEPTDEPTAHEVGNIEEFSTGPAPSRPLEAVNCEFHIGTTNDACGNCGRAFQFHFVQAVGAFSA